MKHVMNRHGEIRRTDAFYNLVIENEEFNKLPPSSQTKLERFNIFPEITDVSFITEADANVIAVNTTKMNSSWSAIVISTIVIGVIIYFFIVGR